MGGCLQFVLHDVDSRGRDTARLDVGMGKSAGYARERTCVDYFKTEIVRRFIAELCNPDWAVAHKWVTKSRDSSKFSGTGGKLTGNPLLILDPVGIDFM